jgi:nickel/cobalt exporter
MTDALFTSILASGLLIAFFHAALPTHWLPFVLVGRGQGWGAGKTLTIAAGAGLGHTLSTMLIGLLLTGAGLAFERRFGGLSPWIVGGLLIALGLFYLLRQALYPHGHAHAKPRLFTSDRAAILALLALVTISPCEAFLPVYLSGVRYGWVGFLLLSAVLATATIAGMVVFTGVSILGVNRLPLGLLERYEAGILGAVLCALGVGIMILDH